jgi:hypothetical protein
LAVTIGARKRVFAENLRAHSFPMPGAEHGCVGSPQFAHGTLHFMLDAAPLPS